MNILRILMPSSQLTSFIHQKQSLDSQTLPQTLLNQLNTPSGTQELQYYLRSPLPVQQQVKLIGLLTLLLMNSSEHYQVIQESLQVHGGSADWVSSKIIIPFKKVLIRCSETAQQFQSIKRKQRQNSINRLVYIVRLLKQLNLIGAELPKIGRYYLSRKDANSQIYQYLGQIYVLFLKHLYGSFTFFLQHYLRYLSKQPHLAQFQQSQHILKWILLQVVPDLHEAIHEINSIKYFDFGRKGFLIKAFAANQQSNAVQQYINKHILAETQETSIYEKKKSNSKPNGLCQNQILISQSICMELVRKGSESSTGSSNNSSPVMRQNPQQYQYIFD